MATFQIKCGQCGKPISPDMKAAMKKKECPYCGTPVVDAAFEALDVAANMEKVLVSCGEKIVFVARKASIMKMLSDGGLPLVEMFPSEEDKVAPAPPAEKSTKLIVQPGQPPLAEVLEKTVSVGMGGKPGRPSIAPTGKALPRDEEGMNLHEKGARRAVRMSGGGVTFGHMPMRRREAAGATSGPGKKLSDIPDRPNPLQMAQSEGLADGGQRTAPAVALPDALPDTVVPDVPPTDAGDGQ